MDQELYEALQKAYQRRRLYRKPTNVGRDGLGFYRPKAKAMKIAKRSTVLYQRYINCGIWVL